MEVQEPSWQGKDIKMLLIRMQAAKIRTRTEYKLYGDFH